MHPQYTSPLCVADEAGLRYLVVVVVLVVTGLCLSILPQQLAACDEMRRHHNTDPTQRKGTLHRKQTAALDDDVTARLGVLAT